MDQMDQKQKPIWVGWVGVAFLAAVIILSILSPSLWRTTTPPAGVPPQKAPTAGPQPTYAPQGQLVPGFPKELILDSAAKTSQSYSIVYSSSTRQYTANFTSSESMTSLYDRYNTYFTANGWTIVNRAASSKDFRGLYARKNGADVNFTVTDQGKARQVIVSYVGR